MKVNGQIAKEFYQKIQTVEGLVETAREHWGQFQKKRVAMYKREGTLEVILKEAAEDTIKELKKQKEYYLKQGLSEDLALMSAWEAVREIWIILPDENESDIF